MAGQGQRGSQPSKGLFGRAHGEGQQTRFSDQHRPAPILFAEKALPFVGKLRGLPVPAAHIKIGQHPLQGGTRNDREIRGTLTENRQIHNPNGMPASYVKRRARE